MLGHCLRRWPNIKPTLGQRLQRLYIHQVAWEWLPVKCVNVWIAVNRRPTTRVGGDVWSMLWQGRLSRGEVLRTLPGPGLFCSGQSMTASDHWVDNGSRHSSCTQTFLGGHSSRLSIRLPGQSISNKHDPIRCRPVVVIFHIYQMRVL